MIVIIHVTFVASVSAYSWISNLSQQADILYMMGRGHAVSYTKLANWAEYNPFVNI
jgi:hypothetical protein